MRGRRTGLPTIRKRAGLSLRGRGKLGLHTSQPPNQNCADNDDEQNSQLHWLSDGNVAVNVFLSTLSACPKLLVDVDKFVSALLISVLLVTS